MTFDKDHLGSVTTFVYDSLNRLTRVVEPGLGCITTMVCDIGGNATGWIYSNDNGPNGKSIAGNSPPPIDPIAVDACFTIDETGQLRAPEKPDNPPAEKGKQPEAGPSATPDEPDPGESGDGGRRPRQG